MFVSVTLYEGYIYNKQLFRLTKSDSIVQFLFTDIFSEVFNEVLSSRRKRVDLTKKET